MRNRLMTEPWTKRGLWVMSIFGKAVYGMRTRQLFQWLADYLLKSKLFFQRQKTKWNWLSVDTFKYEWVDYFDNTNKKAQTAKQQSNKKVTGMIKRRSEEFSTCSPVQQNHSHQRSLFSSPFCCFLPFLGASERTLIYMFEWESSLNIILIHYAPMCPLSSRSH